LLEIAEKQEAKKEEMYDRIETGLQGVQQSLQSICVVSIALGEPKLGDEPAQLHRLTDTVEARLQRVQEETKKSTQALTQVQGVLIEKRSAAEQENLSLPMNFDE
jgi:hypothetical protein